MIAELLCSVREMYLFNKLLLWLAIQLLKKSNSVNIQLLIFYYYYYYLIYRVYVGLLNSFFLLQAVTMCQEHYRTGAGPEAEAGGGWVLEFIKLKVT